MDTQRLFCAGLLSTNAAEALAMSRPGVKMVIELKTPASPSQEQLLAQESTDWEFYRPKPWDLTNISPGKLMALGKTYFRPQHSLAAVRERYRPHLVKKIQDNFEIQEFITGLFIRDGRFASMTELGTRFRDPGWASINKERDREHATWYERQKVKATNPQQEAANRLKRGINFSLMRAQVFRWQQHAVEAKAKKRKQFFAGSRDPSAASSSGPPLRTFQ